MGILRNCLLLGAAGAVGYGLVRRYAAVDLEEYYGDAAVVVTGGASGIGRALVEGLVYRGARVLAVDINVDALEALGDPFPEVDTLALDLAAPGAPQRLLEEALDRLGRLDIVFSNAGMIWARPFRSMTDADIERLVDVNFTMQVRLTRVLLEYFLERGSGAIAYTGSL